MRDLDLEGGVMSTLLHQPMKLLIDRRPTSHDHRRVTSDDGVLDALVKPGGDARLIAGAIARAARRAMGCTTRVWSGDGERWAEQPEAVFKAPRRRGR
jgi:hypothetical protein